MKTFHVVALSLCLGAAPLWGQYAYPPAPPPAPNQYSTTSNYGAPAPAALPALSPAQLDQLLSPVALYPDPLLGVILPASTQPDQVAAAASFVSSNPDPAQIDQQPWDDSVKALAHYPDVVTWMAQNGQWTGQLGSAVATQEPDVFNSIQRLRSNALASGLLVNTPQQQVVVQDNTISIVPAEPGTVYVPSYDPAYVESRTPVGGGFGLHFGVGYSIGAGALFGLDWRDHDVWVDHDRRDVDQHDWRRVANARQSHQVWQPRENVAHWQPPEQPEHRDEHATVVRPSPFARGSSAWNEQTGTPGLTPTGRITPGIERNYAPPHYNQPYPANPPAQRRDERRGPENSRAPRAPEARQQDNRRPQPQHSRDRGDHRDDDDGRHDQ